MLDAFVDTIFWLVLCRKQKMKLINLLPRIVQAVSMRKNEILVVELCKLVAMILNLLLSALVQK